MTGLFGGSTAISKWIIDISPSQQPTANSQQQPASCSLSSYPQFSAWRSDVFVQDKETDSTDHHLPLNRRDSLQMVFILPYAATAPLHCYTATLRAIPITGRLHPSGLRVLHFPLIRHLSQHGNVSSSVCGTELALWAKFRDKPQLAPPTPSSPQAPLAPCYFRLVLVLVGSCLALVLTLLEPSSSGD